MVEGPIEPTSAEEGFGGVPKDTTDYFDPLDFARPSFEAAKERFMDAGKIDVDPEDPALFTAFKRSMDYLADTGMAGLELSDAAFKTAVGTIAELVPGQSQEQEKRLERDLYSMPEAFLGTSPARLQQATDTVAEGVKEVGARLGRPSQAPESMDTVRIFAGYSKSQNPGKTLSGEKAPVSKGLEGKLRFEIDDSQAKTYPFELKTANSKDFDFQESLENFKDGQLDPSFTPFIELGRVLEHPELYNQYPELKEYAVFIDSDLSPLTLGYFDPNKRVIALNKNLVDNPESVKSTLLHEVQHWVQEEEGFSKGSSVFSSEVSKKASPVIKKNRQVEEKYRKEITDKVNTETASEVNRKLMDFLVDIAEKESHTLQDMLSLPAKNFKGESSRAKVFFDQLLEETEQLREAFPDPYTGKSSFKHAFQLGKVSGRLKGFAKLAERTNTQKSFKDILGISPEEYLSFNQEGKNSFVDSLFGIKKPKVDIKDPSYYFYRTKGGEVEARNVQNRIDMSLEERKTTPPVKTEDVIRGEQWIETEGFAEGGSVEKQMNRMYQEGGLQDDGARIEPVTGNEVPPGSMDQEVRDNIPAQLSEGEYVVPADVVRYYGVKFFEDLRGRAKEDFARMEAEGRVGGEPVDSSGVPMEQDEELTPEEMQMLAEALGQAPQAGMAMGGVAQQQQAYDPYQQQQTQYTQPMFQSSRGMQEGGAVEAITRPTIGVTESVGASGTKTYLNKSTGQEITLPEGAVPPAGFEEKTEDDMATPSPTEMIQPRSPDLGGDGPAEGPDTPEAPSVQDYVDMDVAEFGTKIDQFNDPVANTVTNTLSAPLGVLGKAVIGYSKSKTRKNMLEAIKERERLGLPTPEVAPEEPDEPKGFLGSLADVLGLAAEETKEAMSQAEESAAETAEDAEGVGKGSEAEGGSEGGEAEGGSEGGEAEGGDRGDNDEGGGSEQGFAPGGLVKKRQPTKKKKKSSKKYGLGTRP